jgi:hypothetical protein
MNTRVLIRWFVLNALALMATAQAFAEKPPISPITLENFKLVGDLNGEQAAFTLTATAHVENSKGGTLELLSGTVALTDVNSHKQWHVRAEQNRFLIEFDHGGKFPIQVKFNAALKERDNWKCVEFHVAPSTLQPIVLNGLDAETQFEFAGAARPERKGTEFISYLPSDGAVKLSWKQARTEAEGKLFYSAEMLSQISVSPGLMRQTALLNFKVMQGELSRVALILRGEGEVTRVQGDQVLAWNVEPGTNGAERRLVVQLNQPQKDQFAMQVQLQTPLGAFPQAADAMLLRPDAATRFAGYFRIVNEGAVRLEVTQASGLSQSSPEQFPESDVTRAALRITGSQRFAYRFSGADFGLRIQADQVLPELSVSQVLAYRFGENEQTIDSEIELEIREAPLRELLLHVPKGYAIARLSASGLSDYFLRESEEQPDAELRLVYGQPQIGRQVIQLRLEKNLALSGPSWSLPRVDVPKARSVRGHIGVLADTGFRLTPERTQGLTEIATAFFPRKVTGIQSAFRLSDSAWQAAMRVERLPQTVQADVFHLFSIGEGIAYGSSVMNYVVSGAPVSSFKVELSDEYFNVEFTGKDIRGWNKITNGYIVQLHTPVSGSYTLLATYERPFKAQGDTLGFIGARPLDAQSEQGHTLIISAYQFHTEPVEISSGLLSLEPGEVPAEYRLFFDAPVLKAYRYTSRPFNLRLALSPLTQGESVSQVVDRASLTTRISKEGQVLTDVRYFVKNRGNPHLRLTLPEGTQLWSASVNGVAVVPVTDAKANLIPLPQHGDPNAILTIDVKLASRSKDPRRVTAGTPLVGAPVMLAEWKVEPDTNQRLVYDRGSLTPIGGVPDTSGFAGVARMFGGNDAAHAWYLFLLVIGLVACALVAWRWASREGVRKFTTRHVLGAVLGVVALFLGFVAFLNLNDLAGQYQSSLPRELAFLAPVQQASSPLTVTVANIQDKASAISFVVSAWPALFAVIVWLFGFFTESRLFKSIGWILGWTLLAWAGLRMPNGAQAFLWIIVAFLVVHGVIPALRRLWQTSRQPLNAAEAAGASGAAPAVTAWLIGGLVCLLCGHINAAEKNAPRSARRAATVIQRESKPVVAQRVIQEIRVDEKFALATAKIHWEAEKGASLPLLFEPAVLTRISYPSNAVKLVQGAINSKRAQQLFAEKSGSFDIEVQYEVRTTKKEQETGFTLPLPFGLVNRLELTVLNNDVDVLSSQAVSVQRDRAGSNTVARLVLAPGSDVWLGWKPRTRDVKHEKPVFYAEISQLYVPAAGVIEGVDNVAIRPAQGELSSLTFDVPVGATITDVIDPAKPPTSGGAAPAGSIVSLWRFDPDTRKLRVTLNPPQSHAFTLLVRSQVPSGPLPFEQSVGLVSVENAAGQIGLLGVATGNEVQLDNVTAQGFSPINLEDFPADVATTLQSQIAGLTVRRAFRYGEPNISAVLKASAVESDVRIETQDTLSLGEDRTVLAANAAVNITRAGIFRLSFLLPATFDVDSISGPALSHWTELKREAGRVITLHLKGKTEGQQQFAINLTGPGLKATNNWAVPQIVLREASKQLGTLLIVPEQGMRLQVANREGITPLDPAKSGIRQKGVLAFRMLQTPWSLALDVQQVDPWIQVTSLQHATISEAQLKIIANLQYQIENTGLKSLRVFIPTNAEGVRFQGEQISDFLRVPEVVTNGLGAWDVKLHRRIIGPYLLQVSYQTLLPEKAADALLRGVQASDVNLQRGFVTVQTAGRLQVTVDKLPESLQPTEWQSIPRNLQQDLQAAAANFAYRLVDPEFQLPLKLERHEAARLLEARVNNITFNSVISDDGIMLTQTRLELLPGDKRLLNLTLPADAKFWFAFVDQNGVWPWREKDRILIPLEQQSRSGKPTVVELFYSCKIGAANPRSLNLELLAPKFDLPLENIMWKVSLSDKWQVKHWTGSLQLERDEIAPQAAAVDFKTYLDKEMTIQRARTKEAEEFLAVGNDALQKGDPQQARRAFQSAYGLSGHDAAFNEDARVQLHNIKLQQAMIGLNVRQAATLGDTAALGGKFRDLRGRKEVNYTQQDAKDIIDRNSADENAAYMRLAERLVQQQDAAVTAPTAIRANIPEQGRVLTFKRAVLVDTWADLKIGLDAKAAKAASVAVRILILACTMMLLAIFGWIGIKVARA